MVLADIDTKIQNLPASPSAEQIKPILADIAGLQEPLDRQLKINALRRASGLKESFLFECLQRPTATGAPPAYTPAERTAAVQLLRDEGLIHRFLDTCHQGGYVGRDEPLLLGKISTMSRLDEKTLPALFTGESGEGKSALLREILNTCDPSTFENHSRVSPQYFFYRIASLEGINIIFEELNGATPTAEVLRTALSEDHLSLGTVSKTASGTLIPVEIRKSTKRLNVISTWTGGKPDHELSTRMLNIEIRHDANLTAEIYRAKAAAATGQIGQRACPTVQPTASRVPADRTTGHENREDFFRIWRCADSLLRPLPIVIPFALEIAEHFPRNQSRHHRDFEKALTVIRTSARFHQYQRERTPEGAIIAAEGDYDVLLMLSTAFTESSLSVSQPIVDLLKVIKRKNGMTRKALINETGLSDRSVRRYMGQAIKADCVITEGTGASEVYRVIDIPTAPVILPDKQLIFPVQLSNTEESPDTVRDTLDNTPCPAAKLDTRTFDELIADLNLKNMLTTIALRTGDIPDYMWALAEQRYLHRWLQAGGNEMTL